MTATQTSATQTSATLTLANQTATRPATPPPAAPPTTDGVSGISTPALLLVLVGVFLAMADFFIVNVALADIGTRLHASAATLELVVAGYGVTYALLLVSGGRLGDALGRKRLFIAGMAAFTVTSLLCGLAPSAGALVGARALQGAAAAMMVPQVMATVQATTTGHHRLRAMALFGATGGLAAVVGQLLGGLLVAADIAGTGWRPIFLVNVPIGLVALALAPGCCPTADRCGPRRSTYPALFCSVPRCSPCWHHCPKVAHLAGRCGRGCRCW